MARPRGTGEQGEQTRAKILGTAEVLFGERGFEATRLEDIAAAVGVRRAALVYYFRDKRELYRAVLDEVCGGMVARILAASHRDTGPSQQVEAMAEAWVEYVTERPAAARLYLREVANSAPGRPSAILEYARAIYERATEIAREGERAGLFRPVNTLHMLGMLAGATLMFTAGLPALGIEPSYDPLDEKEKAMHRAEIIRMIRALLGLDQEDCPSPTR